MEELSTVNDIWFLESEPKQALDPDIFLTFGKHKGERWTRVPKDYLIWMCNTPMDNGNNENAKKAEKELARRGTDLGNMSIELSPHSIDRASLNLRKKWHETAKDENEGLYTWLMRVATEAWENLKERDEASGKDKEDRSDKRIHYLGMKFIFAYGTYYPTLKTIMKSNK